MTQRAEITKNAELVVVKIGTTMLSRGDGKLNFDRIRSFADQVDKLYSRGVSVLLVSSGSIGAGMGELNLTERPTKLPELQAAAAIGQGKLIAAYDSVFREHGYHAGQVLLTRADIEDRARYLNACDAMHALIDFGAVPVINENDTVSVEEITFSDNDILSALVANLMRADLLIILSAASGLFDGERLVPLVETVDDKTRMLATGSRSRGGTGGMESKLEAAHIATTAGTPVIIAGGEVPDALPRIMDGEEMGTLFLPVERKMQARKRWIGFGTRPKGKIIVDEGARKALLKGGISLLATGILDAVGDFRRGEMVAVTGPHGEEFARGITNYSADEIRLIKGLKSSEIEKKLGWKTCDEIIHCDNMVIRE